MVIWLYEWFIRHLWIGVKKVRCGLGEISVVLKLVKRRVYDPLVFNLAWCGKKSA
jgi:hypothetical protein